MKLHDGTGVRCGGREWTWNEDVDDEGQRSGWYSCDGCGGTARGDDSMNDHACWFEDPDRLLRFMRWTATEGWDASELVAAYEKPWHYREEAVEAGVA